MILIGGLLRQMLSPSLPCTKGIRRPSRHASFALEQTVLTQIYKKNPQLLRVLQT